MPPDPYSIDFAVAKMARRRQLRERYRKLFAATDGTRFLGEHDPEANAWLTTLIVDPARAGWSAPDLGKWLADRDIETRPVWKPMHAQPVFREHRAWLSGTADALFATGLNLPSGSGLREPAQQRVCDAITDFLDAR